MKSLFVIYVLFTRITGMDFVQFDMKHGDLQEVILPNQEHIVCTPSGGLYAETRTPFCLLHFEEHRDLLVVNEACYCLCSDILCKSLKKGDIEELNIYEEHSLRNTPLPSTD